MAKKVRARKGAKKRPAPGGTKRTRKKAAKNKPARARAEGLTRRELGGLLGVHQQTVTKWEQAGLPILERGRRGKPSRYREVDVRAWLAQREADAKANGGVDAVRDRARKERAQAVLAEQTYQMRNRDLVPVAELEQKLNARVMATRTRLLSWQTTLADRVYRAGTLNGLRGVEDVLKAAVHEVLRELAAAGGAATQQDSSAA